MNIGERIGDYEIIEILGAGGMGQVYKVRNTLSNRVEAMKVLLPNLETNPGLADRFLREIKVQAAFDHPNIAKFYTAMRVDNQLLMFMEFVDGVSLGKMLESGPLPPADAAAYTAQVLDALGYAHAHGVVHRDIKPPNIMITGGGSVAKLMDFGIARLDTDTRLTQTGNAVGSLSYMSPEQINGAAPDLRSDIYSLGITLYEMVTGKRPFAGDSGFSIMSAHLKQAPVAPIDIAPSLPPDLSEIILMAIAKDPAARFQSAAAFRGALTSVFPGIARPLVDTPPASAGAHGAGTAETQTMAAGQRQPTPAPQKTAITNPSAPIATPAAPMQAAATIPPPVSAAAMPQSATHSGRRGLYMALGSVITVAVLIAAVMEGPKLIHGGLSDAGAKATSALPTAAASAVATSALPTAASPGADPASALASDVLGIDASTPAPPASTPTTPASRAKAMSNTAAGQQLAQQAGQQAAPDGWHRIESSASAPDATPALQTPAPTPTQAIPVQQPPASAVNPEAAELRQRFNEVSIRATTARSGLHSFEQQQSRQGVGLRGDIREAQTRMDFQIQEAGASLQRGDFESTRTSLRYAQSAVETIEKFLGR